MGCRSDHIHLLARDVRAAASFYQKHFGATLHTPEAEYLGATSVSVSLDGLEIRIRGRRPTDPVDVPAGPAGNGLHHFGIQVEDLDA
ncbi:VOC family protein, partial [Nitrospinota bacterium]